MGKDNEKTAVGHIRQDEGDWERRTYRTTCNSIEVGREIKNSRRERNFRMRQGKIEKDGEGRKRDSYDL